MHGGRRQERLEVRARQAQIPSLAQINASAPWREPARHSCPQGILGKGGPTPSIWCKERGTQACALRLLDEIHAPSDPLAVEPAEEYYRQALALADELGMRPLQAHCHLGLGTLYAKIGQQERSGVALTAAIALYRTMDMTFWLPQAEAAPAQMQSP
jgi:hypothetical protein